MSVTARIKRKQIMKFHANKVVSILLIILMVLSTTATGFADEVPDGAAEEPLTEEEPAKEEAPEPEKAPEPKEEKPEETKAPESAPGPEPAPATEQPESETQGIEPEAKANAEAADGNASAKRSKSGKKALSANKTAKFKLSAFTDGTYAPEEFSFTGGTGRTKVTCDEVIIKDGKATAVFKTTSDAMTHFYMGTVSGNAENTSLYDPSTGQCGQDVYALSNKTAYVPVTLNEEKPFAGRTTAMSEPHWIQYKYKITLTDPSGKESDDTTIPDQPSDGGDQTPDDQGSGDTPSDGGQTPDDQGQDGGSDQNPDGQGQDGGSDQSPDGQSQDGSSDQAPSDSQGQDGQDQGGQDPGSDQSDQSADGQGQSDGTDVEPGKDDQEPGEAEEPEKAGTLKDGTYKVKATTCRKMFYLYPKETDPAEVVLTVKDGKMTATITLTGEGYDYVYMGTPAQAKKAGKSKWIKADIVNGYYTFTIPVSALDKKLPITPHSSKYEADGDPSTEPWRPDKWIMFYSKGAKKTADGESVVPKGKKKSSDRKKSTSGKQKKFKNDKKAAKESKYKDDSGKSTSAVNNSTSLKDGVYTPDRFSWSGGSGRLAYIRCNKITVKGGKAYATIEFSSSKYDSLKANGRVYSKSGGGNSKFTIPVKLNANNTIIGRTTAMSQPHWIKYTIFIYKKGATDGGKTGKSAEKGDDDHVTNTKKLSSEAPDLMGLEFKEEVKVENAKYFKIYRYEQGITLIEIDQAQDTALYTEEKKKDDKPADAKAAAGDASDGQQDSGDKEGAKGNSSDQNDAKDDSSDTDGSTVADDGQGAVEYDDDGNPVARSQNEITEGLYHNNIVNYLVVPDGVEAPAGLDKDCIIIQQPVESAYIASHAALDDLEELGALGLVKSVGMDAGDVKSKALAEAIEAEDAQALGSYEKPDYAAIIKAKTDFAVFPDDVLPEAVSDKADDEKKAESDERKEALEIYQRRFSALAVPMIIDRSADEADNYGEAEWIKVYGAVFGKEKEAEAAFDKFKKDNKKKAGKKQ